MSPTWEIEDDERAGRVLFGDGQVPTRFRANLDDPARSVLVSLWVVIRHGRPEVDAVSVQRRTDTWPFGPQVRTTDLRMPVDGLLRDALKEATKPGTGRRPEVVPVASQAPGETAEAVRAAAATGEATGEATAAATGERRRGKRVDDAHLELVAKVYRDALGTRDPAPTRAVADALSTARSNAGRWVAEARRRGLLGPTRPGQAGDRRP